MDIGISSVNERGKRREYEKRREKHGRIGEGGRRTLHASVLKMTTELYFVIKILTLH